MPHDETFVGSERYCEQRTPVTTTQRVEVSVNSASVCPLRADLFTGEASLGVADQRHRPNHGLIWNEPRRRETWLFPLPGPISQQSHFSPTRACHPGTLAPSKVTPHRICGEESFWRLDPQPDAPPLARASGGAFFHPSFPAFHDTRVGLVPRDDGNAGEARGEGQLPRELGYILVAVGAVRRDYPGPLSRFWVYLV